MPMIEVYAGAGTFPVRHQLAQDLAQAGMRNYVRVQVLTPAGLLGRDEQLGVVKEMTEIVAAAVGDPTLAEQTWVLLTESPEGGWGIVGHAKTQADIAAAAASCGGLMSTARFTDEGALGVLIA
jgi:phenylpyruvate tautomerase PptA (4-oxalocrotonate tautomerase family)